LPFESKEEVVAFFEANRLMFAGKVGFKHYAEKLSDAIAFIERMQLPDAGDGGIEELSEGNGTHEAISVQQM